MKVLADKLRTRVEILRPMELRSALGAVETGWTVAGSRFAGRLSLLPSDRDDEVLRKTMSRRDYLLRLDSLTRQITTKWRLREDGATAEIIGLDADRRDGSLIVRTMQAGD